MSLSSGLPALKPIPACWTELGPRPFFGINPVTGRTDETMSGQVSSIAVDWTNDSSGNTVYIGSSSGGLWRSRNGLGVVPRCELLSEQNRSLSVGSVALDSRTNPPIIYVGTGAPDNSANVSSYTGIGILMSRDGGRTWKQVDSADNGAHAFVGQGFSSILVDPVEPNILLAATGLGMDSNYPHSSIPQNDPAFRDVGIYKSYDSGQSWAQVMNTGNGGANPLSPGGFFHIDLLYEPMSRNYFAAVSGQGLFVSMNRGTDWYMLKSIGWGGGLPDDNQMIRVTLATRNSVLWALVLVATFVPKNAFQLFQSEDGGQTWTQQPVPPDDPPNGLFKGTLMYVAAPPNSNTLLVATDRLHRRRNFRDPASQWEDVNHNLHGDQHAIAFAGPGNPWVWYAGDDGGAWVTTDGGDTWNSLNLDLRTLEFYSATSDSADSGAYVGGMQDNGPALTGGNPAWTQNVPGDGTYVLADPRDSDGFFLSIPRGGFYYLRLSAPGNGINLFAVPMADFVAPFELLPTDPRLWANANFPGFDFQSSRIFLMGGNDPFLVAFDPDASGNKTVPVQLSSGINRTINYVGPDPRDPTVAYLTAGSTLYRLSNISFTGNAVATQITGNTMDPVNPIGADILGHLAVSRAGILYLIKVGFKDGEKIFRSSDGGNNWTNISGNLPNTPLHWVTVHPDDPSVIFVGAGMGVYVALDGGVEGEAWLRLGSGLPNVPVMQLQMSKTRKLVAATFGCGVWTFDVSNLTPVSGAPVLLQSNFGNQGNFELLVPQGNSIRHYVRENDTAGSPWRYLREFGYFTPPSELGPVPEGITFIQSNFKGDGVHGNFEAVVRVAAPLDPGRLDFWYFDSNGGNFKWNGPFPLFADGQPVTGATADPALLQSTFGDRGNFELLVPVGNAIRHYYRDNDDPALPWHFAREFGYPQPGPVPQSVTFIQSNFSGDGVHGNFDAIVRISHPAGPDSLDFWYFDSRSFTWNGPFVLVADGEPVTGVTGDPTLLQSTWGNRGNFELLVPHGEVFRHYYRDNDDPALPWRLLREFGFPTPPNELGPTPRGATFIQSNYKGNGVNGNFEAIGRIAQPLFQPDWLDFWFFDSGNLQWHGEFLLC
jgi:photosystem II stability/assembly factor-like uncharacterized protein